MSDSRYREALIRGERAGEAWTLVPPRTMHMRAGGVRHGRRAGGSLEFRDYREYQSGDDLRHLDWRVFGRSDKLVVKQFHEEVSPFVEIILDGSRSMSLEGSDKGAAALALTALFAAAARNAAFPYSRTIARDRLVKPSDAAARPSQWDDVAFEYSGDPSAAIVTAASMLRPFSIRFLISDLLWMSDPVPLLQALSTGASAVVIVEVLAAADANPPIAGEYRLIDRESGEIQDITFDASAARTYRDALLRHREMWDAAARESGALIVRCVAESLPDDLMFDDLAATGILKPA